MPALTLTLWSWVSDWTSSLNFLLGRMAIISIQCLSHWVVKTNRDHANTVVILVPGTCKAVSGCQTSRASRCRWHHLWWAILWVHWSGLRDAHTARKTLLPGMSVEGVLQREHSWFWAFALRLDCTSGFSCFADCRQLIMGLLSLPDCLSQFL